MVVDKTPVQRPFVDLDDVQTRMGEAIVALQAIFLEGGSQGFKFDQHLYAHSRRHGAPSGPLGNMARPHGASDCRG